MLESGAQYIGPFAIAGCQNGSGILPLPQTDRKITVSQCSDESCQPIAYQVRDWIALTAFSNSIHATLPRMRPVTSRVTRALSSRVLSRHIIVSCTASGLS